MQKEYKTLPSYTKDVDGRTVAGLAAVFGNIDSGGDRIIKGAFKKTIGEGIGRVKHLWMHDPWNPPTAVIKELKEVGTRDLPDVVKETYPEATGGLLVVREYLDTPRGNEILEGIKSGAISEMSFGYDTIKSDFEEGEGDWKGSQIRNLRELRLWDTSDVTWGMNAATVAAKSGNPSLDFKLTTLVHDIQELISLDACKTSLDVTRLKNLMDELNNLLTAEPREAPKVDPALTEKVLRRLRLAKKAERPKGA